MMSMMFMNMAATKTTLTLILGLMVMRGIARLPLRWIPLANARCRSGIPTRWVGPGRTRRPGRAGPGAALRADEAEPDLAAGIVAIGVDQDDALPGAELEPSGQNGNVQRRADQCGEEVVGAVTLGAVPVPVAVIPGQQSAHGLLEVSLRSRAHLHQRQPGRGMGGEDVDQAGAGARAEPLDLAGHVDDRAIGGVDVDQRGVHSPSSRPRRRSPPLTSAPPIRPNRSNSSTGAPID